MTVYPKTAVKKYNLLEYASDNAVGCYFSDKKITSGGAVREIRYCPLDGEVLCAAKAEIIDRHFLCTNKGIYVCADGTNFIKLQETSCDYSFIVEDHVNGGRILAIYGSKVLIYGKNGFITKNLGANLYCGAMHAGRLFARERTDKFLLRWSGEGADNWEECLSGAGSVRLNSALGAINRIINFGEKLVIVREKGLSLFSAYGSPESFKCGFADFSTDNIYPRTAAVCGGKLYFYTTTGLCVFDGSAVSRVDFKYSGHIAVPFFAAADSERYYLGCVTDLLPSRCVAVLNVKTGGAYLLNFPAAGLIDSAELLAYDGENSYKILPSGGEWSWQSGEVYFSSNYKKFLGYVEVDCTAPVKLTVTADGVTKEFTAQSGGRLAVKMTGKNFTFGLSGAGDVTRFEAAAEVIDGV